MNVSQNAEFCTEFSTLNKDFCEMRKFQPKPVKPRGNTGLKTPNPEGFWITPKIRQDRLVRVRFARGSPLAHLDTNMTLPFKGLVTLRQANLLFVPITFCS